jgi:hypothetical protein
LRSRVDLQISPENRELSVAKGLSRASIRRSAAYRVTGVLGSHCEGRKSLLAVLLVEPFVVGHDHAASRLRSGAISRIAWDMT